MPARMVPPSVGRQNCAAGPAKGQAGHTATPQQQSLVINQHLANARRFTQAHAATSMTDGSDGPRSSCHNSSAATPLPHHCHTTATPLPQHCYSMLHSNHALHLPTAHVPATAHHTPSQHWWLRPGLQMQCSQSPVLASLSGTARDVAAHVLPVVLQLVWLTKCPRQQQQQ